MGRDRDAWWTLLALLLLPLATCGGSKDVAPSAPQVKSASGAPTAPALVVVRCDWNGDAISDVLTLDTSRNPLVIDEAIRGTADGGGTDATAAWRGSEVEGALNDALQLHLAHFRSVASQTDLELVLDGVLVTVTVIE